MKKELELYLHIPFCVRKCAYCDFLSFPAEKEIQKQYVNCLIEEIRQFDLAEDYVVSTIFFGGGTPSVLEGSEIMRIMQAIRERFPDIREDAEITIECNPGTVEREKLALYRLSGINRLSFGLQSANNQELKMLGRIHSYEDFLESYDAARKAGFENINVDVMSALPAQTVISYEITLKNVLRLKPEHISAYSLMIEKDTPFYERYSEDEYIRAAGGKPKYLPSEEEERRMYKLTKELLAEHGYNRYEISNYAREGYECKHNVGYWRRENYIGMGIGASSLFENTRFHNTDIMFEYRKCNFEREDEEVLTKKAQMEEFMFLGLRMTNGISRADFKEAFGMEIEGAYGPALAKLTSEGYLEKREGRIFFTEAGIDVSNTLLTEFLL